MPAEFRLLPISGAFMSTIRSIYAKRIGDRFAMGFRVEEMHGNTKGVCHGGMLATFAELLIPMALLCRADGRPALWMSGVYRLGDLRTDSNNDPFGPKGA